MASVRSGITPIPATTKSQSSSRPAFVTTFVTRSPSPSKRSSSWPPCTVTPCSSSTSWKKRPDLLAEERLEGHVLHHHDLALDPVCGGERRRHLAADVAAADQDGPLAALGIGPDRVRVREGAQVVDPVEVAAVHPQPPHVRAGGEQRALELDLLLGRERRDARLGVELGHARAREHLDPLLLPPLVRPEQHLVALLLALEVALRERRAVVGRVRLAAHEQDRALAALLAEPARAVRGGQPAADQQMVYLASRHARPTPPCAR